VLCLCWRCVGVGDGARVSVGWIGSEKVEKRMKVKKKSRKEIEWNEEDEDEKRSKRNEMEEVFLNLKEGS